MVRTPQTAVAETLPPPPLPGLARNEPPVTDSDEAAFRAGAALAMLDCRARADVRAQVPFDGVWRRRLALKAAAASARIARRGEDEATLRDAFFLRHGGDDPGPAGRMLVAWRGLDRSAPLADDAPLHVAETLQLKLDDALRAAIADVQQLAVSAQAAPFAAAQAARVVVARRPDAEILSLWLADAVLAARLRWPRPLPLIAEARGASVAAEWGTSAVSGRCQLDAALLRVRTVHLKPCEAPRAGVARQVAAAMGWSLPYKLSTASEYRRAVELFINPVLGRHRISDVQRADVAHFHQDLHDRPYQANRALGVLSKMFNLAEQWSLRPDGSNPCRHVKKYREVRRERYLSREEMQRLGAALADAQSNETESPFALAAIGPHRCPTP